MCQRDKQFISREVCLKRYFCLLMVKCDSSTRYVSISNKEVAGILNTNRIILLVFRGREATSKSKEIISSDLQNPA
jgi:hypothetical protein